MIQKQKKGIFKYFGEESIAKDICIGLQKGSLYSDGINDLKNSNLFRYAYWYLKSVNSFDIYYKDGVRYATIYYVLRYEDMNIKSECTRTYFMVSIYPINGIKERRYLFSRKEDEESYVYMMNFMKDLVLKKSDNSKILSKNEARAIIKQYKKFKVKKKI